MGIVNVTPDSFSDGGQFLEAEAAIHRALMLAEEGAEIIDVGGESSRPNAPIVSETEELRRVLPVLEGLSGRLSVPISIDTQKPGVARAALAAGASLVNDVAANRTDPEMWELVAKERAGYVVMHMQGSPQTMQKNPVYDNVVQEISSFFETRLARLTGLGIEPEQIILDVGIGFGKKLEHNLQLLGSLNVFAKFHRPLLLGVSRKSFIGSLFGAEPGARLPAGLACACWAVEAGVRIIRTHDVGETRQAVRMMETILKNRNNLV
ncbi:MAG: dihydropteroate synthase [Verrucomicrobia bacterium]|nr:dihydropteroate synthase [Verrucomicrobiota bacterium]